MAVRRRNHEFSTCTVSADVDLYRGRPRLRGAAEIPAGPPSCDAPGSANDHDLGLLRSARAATRPAGTPRLYHLAWEVGPGPNLPTRGRS